MVQQLINVVRKNQIWFFPILFGILSILSVAVLGYFHVVYANTDFIYHLSRLMNIHYSILNNQFPLVGQGSNVPYGLTMTFYPWLTLYPLALLTFVISNKVTLFYTIIALINFITYIISFFSYQTADKSIQRGFLFSVLYTNSSILFNWNFIFGNIGNTLSMTYLPLALFGFINLMHHRRSAIMMFIGITLTLCTHVINGVIFTVTLIILWLLNLNRFKIAHSLRFIGAIINSLIVASIFWYPAFKLLNANHITMPTTFHPMFSGILQYVGSSNNYLYGIPEIIGLLSILNYRNQHFKTFYLEIWLISVGCFLLNITVIALPVSHLFPLFKSLQFTYRLGLIAHVYLALLATKFITGNLNDRMVVLRTPIFITFAYAISLPITNQLSYQFLMHQRPTIHSIDELNRLSLIDAHQKKPFQYISDNTTYRVLKHYNYTYDYAPNPTIKNDAVLDQKFIASVYNQRDEFIQPVPFRPLHNGIQIKNTGYANIQYPIVIYHGIKYRFSINGKPLNNRYINWHLTWQSYRLTLKKLPYGNNLVAIQSAHLAP